MATKVSNNHFINQMMKNKSQLQAPQVQPQQVQAQQVQAPPQVQAHQSNNDDIMDVSTDVEVDKISLSKEEQLANKITKSIHELFVHHNINIDLNTQIHSTIMEILFSNAKITCKGVNLSGKKCSNSGNFLNQNGYCAKHIAQDDKAHLIPKKIVIEKVEKEEKINKVQHHCQAIKMKSSNIPYDNCSSPVGVKMIKIDAIDTDGNNIDHVYLCNKHSSKINKDIAEGKTINVYPYDKCNHKVIQTINNNMQDDE